MSALLGFRNNRGGACVPDSRNANCEIEVHDIIKEARTLGKF